MILRSFRCVVRSVEERKHVKHISGAGKDAKFDSVSRGWYISIDSDISIFMGMNKPDISVGDIITLDLRKEQ